MEPLYFRNATGDLTLKQLVNQQITNLGLDDTQKNINKIRVHFTRSINKDKKLKKEWDKLKTVNEGKHKGNVKILTPNFQKKLLKANQDYLNRLASEHENINSKLIKHDIEENNKILKEMDKDNFIPPEDTDAIKFVKKYGLTEAETIEYTDLSLLKETNPKEKDEILNIMLEAIFNKFFTPFNIVKYERDKKILESTDLYSIEHIHAQQRLATKKNYYYFDRKDV